MKLEWSRTADSLDSMIFTCKNTSSFTKLIKITDNNHLREQPYCLPIHRYVSPINAPLCANYSTRCATEGISIVGWQRASGKVAHNLNRSTTS